MLQCLEKLTESSKNNTYTVVMLVHAIHCHSSESVKTIQFKF